MNAIDGDMEAREGASSFMSRDRESASRESNVTAGEVKTGVRSARGGTLQEGFRWLSRSLGIYAASATLMVTSAWLFVGASVPYQASDAVTGVLGVGFITLLFGGVLGLVALACAVAGFRHAARAVAVSKVEMRTTLVKSRQAFLVACSLTAIAGPLFVVSFFARTADAATFGLSVLVGLLALTSLLFLASLTLVPILLPGRQRTLGLVALAIGAVGILGEGATSIAGFAEGAPLHRTWLTFGGWPLLNWNIPFGGMVAFGAGLLAWTYRLLSRRFAEHQPAPSAAASETGPQLTS